MLRVHIALTRFENGQEMPQKYGKKAQNVSPPLEWDDARRGPGPSRSPWLTSTRSPETTCIGWLPRSARNTTRCQKVQEAPGVQASSRWSPTWPLPAVWDARSIHAVRAEQRASVSDQAPRCNSSGRPQSRIPLATATLIGKFTKIR